MPIVIVQLHHAAFTDSTALAGLAAMSATDEMVLIGSHHVMPEGRVSRLRQAIAPRHLVALLVDDHVPAIERALIEDLLNDGAIPRHPDPYDPPPAALTSWLDTAGARSPQLRTPRTTHRRACRSPALGYAAGSPR
jgi:hypothetical protein